CAHGGARAPAGGSELGAADRAIQWGGGAARHGAADSPGAGGAAPRRTPCGRGGCAPRRAGSGAGTSRAAAPRCDRPAGSDRPGSDSSRDTGGRMSLEDRARDLGRLIGQSAEYQSMRRVSQSLHGDEKASSLLREMEQLQLEAQRMIERGEQPGPEMEQRLDALLGEVQGNLTYQEMVVAQENFDKVMARV